MRELTKSVVGSYCALSVLGAEQLSGLLSGRRTATSLDTITGVMKSGFSHRFQHLYKLGDDAQRGIIDFTDAAVRLNLLGLLKPGIDVATPFVECMGAVTQGDWLVDWQELRNKADIFDLVRNVEKRVGASPDVSLSELVDRAYELGEFEALWAVEGLGHYIAAQALVQADIPKGILSNPALLDIPDKSLMMLNAGIGLAFAEQLLVSLTPNSSPEAFHVTVRRFTEMCEQNTTPGYLGCALESLGLVTRTFQSRMLAAIDATILSMHDGNLLGYFWHGVGRGIYFSRENFIPLGCSGMRWDRIADEAKHETGRHNVIAGLAWAVTLVNMQTPEVMNKLLRIKGNQIVDHDAFANGVSSSLVVRTDMTPHTQFVRDFSQSQVNKNEDSSLWFSLVGEPVAKSIDRYYPVLKQRSQLGEVFRFQCLANLTHEQ